MQEIFLMNGAKLNIEVDFNMSICLTAFFQFRIFTLYSRHRLADTYQLSAAILGFISRLAITACLVAASWLNRILPGSACSIKHKFLAAACLTHDMAWAASPLR